MKDIINKVNCCDWEDGIRQVPDKSVDMTLTDPPYGMDYQSNRRAEKHMKIKNDVDLSWLTVWVQQLKRVMKDDGHLYIFCSWHNIDVFKQAFEKLFRVKNILIWEKNNHGSGDLTGDYAPKYEMVLFCVNNAGGGRKLNGKRIPNVIKTARTQNDNHPTEKPVNLCRLFIEKSTNKGDVVLDTFAGSFPTAQAAKELERDFVCFEIEETHCKKAQPLLEKVTLSLF